MLMFSFFRLLLPFIVYILLVAPTTGQAGIYRYVDEFGKMHFTNVPTTTKFRYYSGEQSKNDLDSLIEESAQRYRLDFLIDECLILELKSVEKILKVHEAQILTYLKLTNISTGLLMNFNESRLANGIKRYRL